MIASTPDGKRAGPTDYGQDAARAYIGTNFGPLGRSRPVASNVCMAAAVNYLEAPSGSKDLGRNAQVSLLREDSARASSLVQSFVSIK